MAIVLQKTYSYRIYRGTTYLGALQNVVSDFVYSQDINSPAVQLNVEVDLSADNANVPPEPIYDEAGNPILDENGDTIYEERQLDVVSSLNPNALIQENNNLKVYEISDDYPNGKLVFDGYIMSWDAKMGSDTDNVTMVAVSNGIDLADYIIEGGTTLDASQGTGATNVYVFDDSSSPKGAGWNKVGQSWQVGASASALSAILVKLAAFNASTPVTVTVSVYADATFAGTPIASASKIISSTTPAEYTFGFATTLNLTVGATYYFSVTTSADSASGVYVYYNSGGDLYANGTMYESNYGGGSGGGSWTPVPIGTIAASSDLYFKTYYSAAATSSPYSSTDPTTILNSIITNYNSAGGLVTTSAATYDVVGSLVSYTFKVNTILEGVQKCLDLAPSNYYWYVNPATQVLYFKATPTTPTHKFIKGRHFSSIDIGATVEQVRNILYFSGGDTGGGVNLFSKYTNATSLAAQGRRRLERMSDNRVTLQGTANLIGANFLAYNAAAKYNSPVRIHAATYDITIINVGDTIKLQGFGNFVDTLTLQVARITRNPDYVDLTLGVLLERQSDILAETLREIDKLQTVANPSTPS